MIGCPQSDSRNQTEKSVSSSHARNSMRSGLHLFLVGRPLQRLSRAVRARLRESVLVERPLTPTLSPQAARGRTGAVPRAVAAAGGERTRRIAAAGDFAHPTLCLRTIRMHFSRDFLGRRVCQANGPDTEYPASTARP